jgi:hypothetical protein
MRQYYYAVTARHCIPEMYARTSFMLLLVRDFLRSGACPLYFNIILTTLIKLFGTVFSKTGLIFFLFI